MTILRRTCDLELWYWSIFRLTIFCLFMLKWRSHWLCLNNSDLVDPDGYVWTAFDLEF